MIANKFYAGIGSRETPWDVLRDMTEIAITLEIRGYTLRSGAASGADSAFQEGVGEAAQIWIPWKSFAIDIQNKFPKHTYRIINKNDSDAMDSVNQFHPNGLQLKEPVRLLMARNFRQIIGKVFPNSEFVICWTKDGGPTGGTGQAIRIANHYNIPVYNLFDLTKQEILDKVLPQ